VEIPEAGMTLTASYQGSDEEAGARQTLIERAREIATVRGGEPGPLTVRSRQPGDRLQPLGRPGMGCTIS
jgi:hypothetical protein